MAKVKNNNFTTGLSGKFGNIIFRQMKDGTTVVSAAPDFTDRVFSEAQLDTQSRFQQASAYARAAAREIPLYAQLAEGTSKNAYNVALSDWYHSPVIHQVTVQEGRIHVEATDNVLVSNVRLSISDEQGQTLEQGEAARISESLWEYRTATLGDVLVEAFDLAGNRAQAHVVAIRATRT
jgi:hypothetical protein